MTDTLQLCASDREQVVNKTLANRYDALNQLFAAAEQQLKKLKPVHDIWVEYNHQDPPEGWSGAQHWEVLGLTLHGGQWRLCHGSGNQNLDCYGFGPEHVKPVIECDVATRVAAAQVVKKLRDRIIKSKEEFVPHVDEAIATLKDFCNS